MPLILLPMNPSDIPTLISIQNDALDTDPLHSLTMALPHSAFTINAMEKRLESELKDPTSGFMTVVDTDIRAGPDIVGEGEQRGRVIALARWHFYTKERPEEEWNVKQTRVLGDEINWPLLEAFLGPVGRCRREYVKGRRHACKSCFSSNSNRIPRVVEDRSVLILQCLIISSRIQIINGVVQGIC